MKVFFETSHGSLVGRWGRELYRVPTVPKEEGRESLCGVM